MVPGFPDADWVKARTVLSHSNIRSKGNVLSTKLSPQSMESLTRVLRTGTYRVLCDVYNKSIRVKELLLGYWLVINNNAPVSCHLCDHMVYEVLIDRVNGVPLVYLVSVCILET